MCDTTCRRDTGFVTTLVGMMAAVLILASLAFNAVVFVAASLAVNETRRRHRHERALRDDLDRILDEIVGPPTSKHVIV